MGGALPQWAYDVAQFTPLEFNFVKGRAITISDYPQFGAFSRAVMDEKSYFPLFLVVGRGGGEGCYMVGNFVLRKT